MTLDDIVEAALETFPDAFIDTDDEGQVVVHTGLYPSSDDANKYGDYDHSQARELYRCLR